MESALNSVLQLLFVILGGAVVIALLWIPPSIALWVVQLRLAVDDTLPQGAKVAFQFLALGTLLKTLLTCILFVTMASLLQDQNPLFDFRTLWFYCIPPLWILETIAFLKRSSVRGKVAYLASQLIFSLTLATFLHFASQQ